MPDAAELVFIIDDDPNVLVSLGDLLNSVGIQNRGLGSIAEYIASPRINLPACLVLDVYLPDINGLEFQAQAHRDDHPPIVFLTGSADVSDSVNAMKRGAVDYLTKPFVGEALLSAVRAALDLDRRRRLEREELIELRERFNALSPRELDVLPLVVSGLLNKQAAAELGISEATFQFHRGNVMQKMSASSLPDLVRMATRLGVTISHSRYPGARAQ